MRIDELPRLVEKGKRRRGQGRGSGSGHTSGRGNKGQKARGRVGVLFEGTKWKKSLVRRLPFLRGKGRMKTGWRRPMIVKLSSLGRLVDGARVDVRTLVENGIVGDEARKLGVKIVAGGGKWEKKMMIAVPVTKKVAEMIIEAGGEVLK